MTMQTYALNQLEGYGYSSFSDIPDEMLDYLPENLDNNQENEDEYL